MAAPNVLLVTVDCMRRDRISAYGHERRTTPFLDSLLDISLHCTSAHSTSSWTAPAVASMLTGLYPHHHGAGFIEGDPKNLDLQHLPSAVGERWIVADTFAPKSRAALTGVAAAFFPFYESPDVHARFPLHQDGWPRSDARLVQDAADFVGIMETPFFCWVHLGGAHDPLDVPRGDREVFGELSSYRAARRWRFTKRDDDIPSAGFTRYRHDRELLYDAAIRIVDARIATLWESLGDARDRTVLIVTADHGEELWEHRDDEIADFDDPRNVAGAGHGQNLWQEILLVPLIVHGPGIDAAAIDANVSLVDVAPTILAATGADGPADLDGVSLLGGVPADRPILAQGVAYGHEKAAVIEGDRKLLSSPADGYERLWALGPGHREATTVGEPGIADRLRALLPGAPVPSQPLAPTVEIEAHLRDLGYLE